MKKNLFLLLCLFVPKLLFGQHNVFIWNNATARIVSIDSINIDDMKVVSIQTGDPSLVTDTTMTTSFVISNNKLKKSGIYHSCQYHGKDCTIEYGICFSSKSSSPTIMNGCEVAEEQSTGYFNATIENLSPGTVYYYRPFLRVWYDNVSNARNDLYVIYGQIKSFTTTGIRVNEPEYVDLGLSVKWATCNLGADNSWQLGNKYKWGEILPYNSISSNYKNGYEWGRFDSQYEGYSTISKYNKEDGRTQLESEDDAATSLLGSEWRMPTNSEIYELKNKCTWTKTRKNGYVGYLVTGINGNTIFLPSPSIWSSTLCTSQSYYPRWQIGPGHFADYTRAFCLYLDYDYYLFYSFLSRNSEYYIRPVHQ